MTQLLDTAHDAAILEFRENASMLAACGMRAEAATARAAAERLEAQREAALAAGHAEAKVPVSERPAWTRAAYGEELRDAHGVLLFALETFKTAASGDGFRYRVTPYNRGRYARKPRVFRSRQAVARFVAPYVAGETIQ